MNDQHGDSEELETLRMRALTIHEVDHSQSTQTVVAGSILGRRRAIVNVVLGAATKLGF